MTSLLTKLNAGVTRLFHNLSGRDIRSHGHDKQCNISSLVAEMNVRVGRLSQPLAVSKPALEVCDEPNNMPIPQFIEQMSDTINLRWKNRPRDPDRYTLAKLFPL
jgi:hypothetical protein